MDISGSIDWFPGSTKREKYSIKGVIARTMAVIVESLWDKKKLYKYYLDLKIFIKLIGIRITLIDVILFTSNNTSVFFYT